MTEETPISNLAGLLARTREAFLMDPGYATAIAKQALALRAQVE